MNQPPIRKFSDFTTQKYRITHIIASILSLFNALHLPFFDEFSLSNNAKQLHSMNKPQKSRFAAAFFVYMAEANSVLSFSMYARPVNAVSSDAAPLFPQEARSNPAKVRDALRESHRRKAAVPLSLHFKNTYYFNVHFCILPSVPALRTSASGWNKGCTLRSAQSKRRTPPQKTICFPLQKAQDLGQYPLLGSLQLR